MTAELVGVWLPALVAGMVSLVAPLALKPMLRRRAVLDLPTDRSSHVTPTLRGGGLAQLLGVCAALFVAALVPLSTEDQRILCVVLGGAIAMGLIGLADDLSGGRGVGVTVRAGLQLVLGVMLAELLFGSMATWWGLALAGLFVAAYVNFTNFMDGVNWISGVYGLVAGSALACTGWLSTEPWLVTVGLIVALCFLVFLPWNVVGAGMFLGDVGSYLLGGIIAGAVVGATAVGVSPIALFGPVSIYLTDAITVLARRIARGEPVFRPHRTHAYQRLTNVGFSHRAVALLVGAATAMTSLIGFLSITTAWPWPLLVVGIGAVCAGYVMLPAILGDRLPPRLKVPLEPASAAVPIPARPGFKPKVWAVVGATGFIGRAVVEHLRSTGVRVVCVKAPRLTLDPSTCRSLEVFQSVDRPLVDELASVLAGAEVVVNTAGLALPDAPASGELYGANALLPVVVARAAESAGVARLVHLSSAAVQGRQPVLDESVHVWPFSPYSRSKALGEASLIAIARETTSVDLVILRATSVQGEGRGTTSTLGRIASSPLASVAAPGTQPSIASSLNGLVRFVHEVGAGCEPLSMIQLQPWEGMSVSDVLRKAGGREPVVLPAWACRAVLAIGRAGTSLIPELAGLVRRIEVMWFGQGQAARPSQTISDSREASARSGDLR